MASFGDHRDRFARFTWFLPLDEPKESNPGSALRGLSFMAILLILYLPLEIRPDKREECEREVLLRVCRWELDST